MSAQLVVFGLQLAEPRGYIAPMYIHVYTFLTCAVVP